MPSVGGVGVRDRPCTPGAHSLVGRRQNLNKLPQSIEVGALMKVYESAPGITGEEQVKARICWTTVSKLKSLRPRIMTLSQARGTCYVLGSPGDCSEQVLHPIRRGSCFLAPCMSTGANVALADFLGS